MKSFLWKVIAVASAASLPLTCKPGQKQSLTQYPFSVMKTLLTLSFLHIIGSPCSWLSNGNGPSLSPSLSKPILGCIARRKGGRRERWGWLGRWKKFDVMVDVVVWGDACLLACLLVLQFAGLTFLDGTT